MSREKFTKEYMFKASPEFLYNYISTASGLSVWFADDVNIDDKKYIFVWEGSEEEAELIGKRQNKYTKFRWANSSNDEFFQFEIQQDELTNDVSLLITDFEDADNVESAIKIYDLSINKLKLTIGG
jgi:hypothetical protein